MRTGTAAVLRTGGKVALCREDNAGRTGQGGQEGLGREDRKDWAGRREQEDRAGRTGQGGHSRRTGQQGQGRVDWVGGQSRRTGQGGQGREDWAGRTGQGGQGREDRTRTVVPQRTLVDVSRIRIFLAKDKCFDSSH